MGMKVKSVAEALEYVAANPHEEVNIDTPAWYAVGSALLTIANNPDPRVRGSLQRSSKAQKIFFDRLVGRRRPGTHPAQVSGEKLEFTDLTVGVLAVGESDEELADADAAPGREATA